MMVSNFGRAPWRFIVIQFLVLTGLLAFIKFYLPHHARELAARDAATRELKINSFFQDSVVENSTREVSVPFDGAIVKRHPKRLRITFSAQDAESVLGVPNTNTTDFRGGQHLTWTGTSHKLEAAFDSGRLYCLIWRDLGTHHGELAYHSEDQWSLY
jgi:hypothetical protein